MRHRARTVAALLFSALLAFTAPRAFAAASITPIPNTFGGVGISTTNISGDGTTVVGTATDADDVGRAFRWTLATGLVDIGPGNSISQSNSGAVSHDGSVVVGIGNGSQSSFRWTAASGPVDLGTFPGGSVTFAAGISADGSTIVGSAVGADQKFQGFKWTAATGLVATPVASSAVQSSLNTAISADGSVIVGFNLSSNDTAHISLDRAFRYTPAGGFQDLGVETGFDRSVANAVSGDGNTVVGFSQIAHDGAPVFTSSAFRWTQSTGLVPLFFDDESSSYAEAASFDGSQVVGHSTRSGSDLGVLWTSTLGAVDLNTYLPTIGIDLTGWDLTDATGISDDGNTFTGYGTYNGQDAAWVVTLVPEPGSIALLALAVPLAMRRSRRLRML